jgi:phospholipid/cholesterol/gamma-HCH transport system substrate-binding protein
MKPFRERNPVPIGAVGIGFLAVLVYTAFHAQDFTIFGGGGHRYYADFAEAGDIKKENEVRVAGVKVGKVTAIDLVGDHVRVTFRLQPGKNIGPDSRAAIKLKTVVGARYLEIDSEGAGNLPPGGEIPISRTASLFTVQDALGGLTTRSDAINVDQLARSFTAISDTFQNTPGLNKAALVGLSRLSRTIASRDAQLSSLLDHAHQVTATLNSRDAELTKLIGDSDLVLRVVQQRKNVINAVLVHSAQLATELTGLARDNRAALAPALADLRTVLAVLVKDRDQLDRTLQLLAPFARDFTNTLANGRWFDTYVQNLPPNVDVFALLNGLLGTTITSTPGASSAAASSSQSHPAGASK